MEISQGEDDGHIWVRVSNDLISADIDFWSPERITITTSYDESDWRGPHLADIIGKDNIEKFLKGLEFFIAEARKDLVNPYNS